MGSLDPRLHAALREQLEHRRRLMDRGARHVGWKMGMGERERIGSGPVIGYLTSATVLASGGAYRASDAVALHADAEVALELGTDGEIVGYGAALELVDLGPPRDAERIVATNVFHRAVAFGPRQRGLPDVEGRLIVDGEERGRAPARRDHAEIVRQAARLLEAVGERFRPGDLLITGSVVQTAVRPGERVVADLGALGRVEATIVGAM
jgi:2-keto-4-pentenoate hydratase